MKIGRRFARIFNPLHVRIQLWQQSKGSPVRCPFRATPRGITKSGWCALTEAATSPLRLFWKLDLTPLVSLKKLPGWIMFPRLSSCKREEAIETLDTDFESAMDPVADSSAWISIDESWRRALPTALPLFENSSSSSPNTSLSLFWLSLYFRFGVVESFVDTLGTRTGCPEIRRRVTLGGEWIPQGAEASSSEDDKFGKTGGIFRPRMFETLACGAGGGPSSSTTIVGWTSWFCRESDGPTTLAWERFFPRFAELRLFKRVAVLLYLSLRLTLLKSPLLSSLEGRGTIIFAICFFFFAIPFFFFFLVPRRGGGGLVPSWPTPRLNILYRVLLPHKSPISTASPSSEKYQIWQIALLFFGGGALHYAINVENKKCLSLLFFINNNYYFLLKKKIIIIIIIIIFYILYNNITTTSKKRKKRWLLMMMHEEVWWASRLID